MGLLDKAKQAAEQAAAKAREGVEDVQAKRDLGQAYNELGKAAFELAESGDLSHPGLDAAVERVRAAQARAGSDGGAAEETADTSYGASRPPETPT
ncbi:MAG TPA: hypothetical protein VFU56_06630 [Gaiellaceae bacterium]|nr:hypothetical protein [Gaiellaceae bacterium]